MEHIYMNDIGTTIKIKVQNRDISTGSNYKIYYKSPDGTTGSWNASLHNTDTIEYAVGVDDFNVAGKWQIQGYVELPGWSGFTDMNELMVLKDLSVIE